MKIFNKILIPLILFTFLFPSGAISKRFIKLPEIKNLKEKVKDPKFIELLKKSEVFAFHERDANLIQILNFTYYPVPCSRVFKGVVDVANYVKFVDDLNWQKITKKKGSVFELKWSIDLIVGAMTGKKIVRYKKNRRVEFRYLSGDINTGTEIFRFVPIEENKHCILSQQRKMELRSASLMLKLLVKFEPLVEPAINFFTNFMMAFSLKAYIREGISPSKLKFKDRPLNVENKSLKIPSWIRRYGIHGFLEAYSDGSLKQVSLGLDNQREVNWWKKILNDPAKFSSRVKMIDEFSLKDKTKNLYELEWDFSIASSSALFKKEPLKEKNGFSLNAIKGDLTKAKLIFNYQASKYQKSLMVMHCNLDYSDSNWVTRKMIKKNPLTNHALNAMGAYIILKSLNAGN